MLDPRFGFTSPQQKNVTPIENLSSFPSLVA